MATNERNEWRRRIGRALACIKSDGVSELTRRAGLIAVPVAASIACGYNADVYKKNASRQDYSTTSTTGAYTWNTPLGGEKSSEEEAQRAQREERETAERQTRAQQQQQPAAADKNAPPPATAEERAAFSLQIRNE